MKEYVIQIERFLTGQMSQEEEGAFKKSLMTDAHMRTYAFIMAFFMKVKKQGKVLAIPTFITTFAPTLRESF